MGSSAPSWTALVLLLATAAAAHAEESPHAGGDAPPLVLAPVVVTPSRTEESSFDVPASIDVLRREDVHGPGALASEELRRAPGATVQSRGTLAQEEQLVLRGFGARSQFGTRGIRIYVDYIPTSTPDGQGSTAVIDLASTQRIEVLRGAFSALYGNHSGGVVQAFTREGTARPTLDARLLVGSNATSMTGLVLSASAGPADWVASLSHFETGGFRVQSAASRDLLSARLNLELPGGGVLSGVVHLLDQPQSQDPGGLDAEQAASSPARAAASALAFRTRRSLRNEQGGLVYRQRIGESDDLTLVGFLGARENEQYLGIPLAAQDALTSSGGVSTFDRLSWGLRGWWTHSTEVAGGPLTVTGGGEYERAREDRRGFLNDLGVRAPPAGVSGALKRSEIDVTESWGIFAQGEWRFVPPLSLTLGLRHTRVGFSTDDRFVCTPEANTTGTPPGTCSGSSQAVTDARQNPDDGGSVTYAAWTPVAGLLWRISPRVHAWTNVGRSFETPALAELAYRPDGGAGFHFELRPSTSWQWELGARAYLGRTTRADAALFRVDTADELVVATSAGGRTTYRNVPGTRRTGAELGLRSTVGAGFEGRLAATWLAAELARSFRTSGGDVAREGNAIPGVPAWSVLGELSWTHAATGFTTGVEVRAQGEVQVDDRNTEAAAAYALLAAWIGLRQEAGPLRLHEFVRGENLLDEAWITAVAVNAANGAYYYPGAGRTFLAGITAGVEL